VTETRYCRVCQSDDVKLYFTANQFDILRCRRCGLVQVAKEPLQSELDSIYQKGYFAPSKYDDTTILLRENSRRLKLVRGCLPGEGKKLLEVGCGPGDFIQLAKQHYEVHGFDLSQSAVDIARTKNEEIAEHIWAGRVEDQNLPPAFYDAICMWDVIEHLWDPLSTCDELLSCMKSGGYIFLSSPNAGAITAKLLRKYWAFMTPPEHLSMFSRRSLVALFEEKLNMHIVRWMSKGKWTNLGFVIYKLGRVVPRIITEKHVTRFNNLPISKWQIYVPTGDIHYTAIQKI